MTDIYHAGRWAAVHAAPTYLDCEKTLGKIDLLTGEAAAGGAQVVAYSESFLPGFPVWCLIQRPIQMHQQFKSFYENSIDVPGPETHRLSGIARRHGVWLSIGVSERAPGTLGSLYNANLIFSPEGTLVQHHRKIVATWAERLVWGHGDGADLSVLNTDLGKLGALICGENTNPLARYALMAQGEQIHIATWPPAWPFQRGGNSDTYRRWIEIRSAAHAFEAKAYCLSVAALLDEDYIIAAAGGDDFTESVLRESPPAVSLALDPSGNLIGEPIQGREGILYADVDTSNITVSKMAHDVVGNYQRFDIFNLTIDQTRRGPINIVDFANDYHDVNVVDSDEESDVSPKPDLIGRDKKKK